MVFTVSECCLNNYYVVSPYCQVEMCAGRGACCPLVSDVEYADWTDTQTGGRQTVTLRFPSYAVSVMKALSLKCWENCLSVIFYCLVYAP